MGKHGIPIYWGLSEKWGESPTRPCIWQSKHAMTTTSAGHRLFQVSFRTAPGQCKGCMTNRQLARTACACDGAVLCVENWLQVVLVCEAGEAGAAAQMPRNRILPMKDETIYAP
jgi:hypothetical protein